METVLVEEMWARQIDNVSKEALQTGGRPKVAQLSCNN